MVIFKGQILQNTQGSVQKSAKRFRLVKLVPTQARYRVNQNIVPILATRHSYLAMAHVKLKCYVVIDLKPDKLNHADLGQMQEAD